MSHSGDAVLQVGRGEGLPVRAAAIVVVIADVEGVLVVLWGRLCGTFINLFINLNIY